MILLSYLKSRVLTSFRQFVFKGSVIVNAVTPPVGGPSGDSIFRIPNFSGFTNVSQIVDNIVQLLFFLAGLLLFINLVIGGVQWIGAGGDPKAIDGARNRITQSIIGIAIVVGAFALTRIIEHVFGIRITTGFNFS